MPEDAPVISTTFPATSSLNMVLMVNRRNLNKKYGGMKKGSVTNATKGTVMFKNLLINSIASPQ